MFGNIFPNFGEEALKFVEKLAAPTEKEAKDKKLEELQNKVNESQISQAEYLKSIDEGIQEIKKIFEDMGDDVKKQFEEAQKALEKQVDDTKEVLNYISGETSTATTTGVVSVVEEVEKALANNAAEERPLVVAVTDSVQAITQQINVLGKGIREAADREIKGIGDLTTKVVEGIDKVANEIIVESGGTGGGKPPPGKMVGGGAGDDEAKNLDRFNSALGGIWKKFVVTETLLRRVYDLVSNITAAVTAGITASSLFSLKDIKEALMMTQDLYEVAYQTHGITRETAKLQKEYSNFAGIRARTGQDEILYQKILLKNLKKGNKSLKENQDITKDSLTASTLIGSNAEATADVFSDWNLRMGLSADKLHSLTYSLRDIARTTGVTGDNLLDAAKSSEQFLKNMRNSRTLTSQAARNVIEIQAAAKKLGVEDFTTPILEAASSVENLYMKADSGTKALLFQAANMSGRIQDLQTGTLLQTKAGIKDLATGLDEFFKQISGGYTVKAFIEADEKGLIPPEVKAILNLQLSKFNSSIEEMIRTQGILADTGLNYAEKVKKIDEELKKAVLTEEERTALLKQQKDLKINTLMQGLANFNEQLKTTTVNDLDIASKKVSDLMGDLKEITGLNGEMAPADILKKTLLEAAKEIAGEFAKKGETGPNFENMIRNAGGNQGKLREVMSKMLDEQAKLNVGERAALTPQAEAAQTLGEIKNDINTWVIPLLTAILGEIGALGLIMIGLSGSFVSGLSGIVTPGLLHKLFPAATKAAGTAPVAEAGVGVLAKTKTGMVAAFKATTKGLGKAFDFLKAKTTNLGGTFSSLKDGTTLLAKKIGKGFLKPFEAVSKRFRGFQTAVKLGFEKKLPFIFKGLSRGSAGLESIVQSLTSATKNVGLGTGKGFQISKNFLSWANKSLEGTFGKIGKTIRTKMGTFGTKMGTFSESIGKTLVKSFPTFTKLGGKLGGVFSKLGGKLAGLSSFLPKFSVRFASLGSTLGKLSGPLAVVVSGLFAIRHGAEAAKNAAYLFGVEESKLTDSQRLAAEGAGFMTGILNDLTFGIFDSWLGASGSLTSALAKFLDTCQPLNILIQAIVLSFKALWEILKGIGLGLWEIAKGIWEAILIIFEPIKEIFFEIGNALADAFEPIGELFSEIWGAMAPIFDFVGLSNEINPTAIDSLNAAIKTFAPSLKFVGKVIGESIKIFAEGVAWMLRLLKPVIKFIGAIVRIVVEAFIRGFKWILAPIKLFISGIMQIYNGIMEVISGFWNWDAEKLKKGLSDIFWGAIDTVLGGVISAIEVIFAPSALMVALGAGFIGLFDLITDYIVDPFKDALSQILDYITSWLPEWMVGKKPEPPAPAPILPGMPKGQMILGGAKAANRAIPELAIGTKEVLGEGLAVLHPGEAVIPRVNNSDVAAKVVPGGFDGARKEPAGMFGNLINPLGLFKSAVGIMADLANPRKNIERMIGAATGAVDLWNPTKMVGHATNAAMEFASLATNPMKIGEKLIGGVESAASLLPGGLVGTETSPAFEPVSETSIPEIRERIEREKVETEPRSMMIGSPELSDISSNSELQLVTLLAIAKGIESLVAALSSESAGNTGGYRSGDTVGESKPSNSRDYGKWQQGFHQVATQQIQPNGV